ncbi:hypothetical protein MMC31_001525 [Peltigera leucophlebia]|nr:hypothetical protein [Peltigera leucophlebia]
MSKRTVFTTITALPAGISRETVIETLHSHVEMIDLNPLVEERHPIKAPAKATAEEFHCIWYSLTDKVSYLPGGLISGRVTYQACFHDLVNGLQTHCYAPMGLDIKGKWTLGGTLPHEPKEAVEIGLGVPKNGLWLREDVDMRCNMLMTTFVKKTLKKAHLTLVERLVEKSHLLEAESHNSRVWETTSNYSYHSGRSGPPPNINSPDPSLFSRQSTIIQSGGSPGMQPAMPSPSMQPRLASSSVSLADQESQQQHQGGAANPYPAPLNPWPSPPVSHVDPAYQQANPYGSSADVNKNLSKAQILPNSSFNPYDPRNNPAVGYGHSQPAQQNQNFAAVELPTGPAIIAELDSGPAVYSRPVSSSKNRR